jgi:type III restriction enzyme
MKQDNPILNNPYEEPRWHYSTNLQGELDYANPLPGRRVFTPDLQTIPVRQEAQADLLEFNEVATAAHGTHLVNLLRREIAAWRADSYPQTTRITRELLLFWFLNEERDFTLSLFFAQREAIETAIWLNEVAEKSNVGQHILRQLEGACKLGSSDPANQLARIAFKMATGTGKTVVMAALIAYHYFNRAEYRNDTRFADNFLIITPGITIRDRLGVLRVDTRTGAEAQDYYHVRYLVPKGWRTQLAQLNSKLVLTNYHAFELKTLQGNKRSPFDGKVGPDGKKQEAREAYPQMLSRLVGHFKAGSRLLVINDEAHHCYLPKEDDRTAEGEQTKEENVRASIWFNGLVRLAERFKVRSIYDLSATPYYLTGSGYDPYSLFPWVVTDFGLIESIESGLVKIPFLPQWDDTPELKMPVLRNLYEHIKERLPKAGQKRLRARAKEAGEELREAPPQIPDTLKAALKQFYRHYEEEFRSRKHSLTAQARTQLEMEDQPPVFIVVCNNTSVSREVYKYIAGYEQPTPADGGPPQVIPGVFDLFTNYEPATLHPRPRPPSLLIDSDALENSGQIDEGFKRVFAREIDIFKRDYARIHGQGAAELITDAELLREVVNTVGKRNTLGAHIRCIVSVSMLTEGWDANTVTHIVGIRAFGSQLLCEQVAGRALRRRSYFLQAYDKDGNPTSDKRRIATRKFPPEYAHIIGVPFKMFKGGKTKTPPPQDTTRVYAMAERADRYEIAFPSVEGYRVEYPGGCLAYSFKGLDDYALDGSKLPTKTILANAISAEERQLSLDDVLNIREQEIIYRITKDLVRDHFSSEPGNPEFHRFHGLKAIVAEWYDRKVRVIGKDDRWKKLLYFSDPKPLVAHVARAITPAPTTDGRPHIRPILNYYNPTGSSRFVRGQTSRDTHPTKHSHANVVVIESGWEAKVAKALDDLTDEGLIQTWIKNNFLDFRIPYVDQAGKERDYYPDFILRASPPGALPVQLIVEVTGMKKDKPEKVWAVENRWLPAVNAIRQQRGWPRWDFLELDEEVEVADARNRVLKQLRATHAA